LIVKVKSLLLVICYLHKIKILLIRKTKKYIYL
jgi:hypothetical protein